VGAVAQELAGCDVVSHVVTCVCQRGRIFSGDTCVGEMSDINRALVCDIILCWDSREMKVWEET